MHAAEFLNRRSRLESHDKPAVFRLMHIPREVENPLMLWPERSGLASKPEGASGTIDDVSDRTNDPHRQRIQFLGAGHRLHEPHPLRSIVESMGKQVLIDQRLDARTCRPG